MQKQKPIYYEAEVMANLGELSSSVGDLMDRVSSNMNEMGQGGKLRLISKLGTITVSRKEELSVEDKEAIRAQLEEKLQKDSKFTLKLGPLSLKTRFPSSVRRAEHSR